MNRKELVDAMSASKELAHLAKKDLDAFVGVFVETVKKAVKKGDEVALVGFGTFCRVTRKARTGRNPLTGEKLKIKAKNVAKFKAGKAFKDML